ncbi:MGDG synthase family glycosyltransferase [Sulfobacillus harzensis]|uniref:Galactosyldiacylglycerol synthase n=1 Tax=Sulfobacillus harzensis TaxID=2729629 RepID=A0A7Y0L185_9FIRM|nr:glycosyltransferase [Sulfobacillus harzensis]NMP21142.1 galactosyldiacylglycerol synthase [Sulfobacillus harzensis]
MRVVIASLPIGTGHDIAARALAESFAARGAEVEFSHHLVVKVRMATRLYFFGIRFLPGVYGTLFRLGDRQRQLWQNHRRSWRQAGREVLGPVYDAYRPDVVVATHPFALSAWSAIKESHPNLKLVGVLTDLSVHQFWYEPTADGYAVWMPEQVQDLARWGYPTNKVWQTGIPIRSSFSFPSPLLEQLRHGPIVLLGGGLGMGPYVRILRSLAELPHPVLAICGHNEKLRWALDEHRWPERVHIVGYIEHMPSLLKQARLVVGKPGGVTAAEVCQSQVPWVLTHWIAGQEEANRDRLVMHDLAVRGDNNLKKVVTELIEEGSPARQQMIDSQRLWARPRAADQLAEQVFSL